MLRKIIATVTVIVTLFVFISCSGKADFGDTYYPPMGGDELAGEEYTEIVENQFVSTAENPNSYFSLDSNTASYPNLRSIIQNGYDVPKDAVRVEEMLNYFSYEYPSPSEDEIFSITSAVFDTPYNSQTKLMTVGVSATKVEFSGIRNNLVFLIDVSGSMYDSAKLPLVQESFKMLTENLNEEDRISIVTYAGDIGVALDGAFGYEKKKITAVIEDLTASGSTSGAAGIQKAYELASKYFIEGGNNRVILATDGDFNVGISKVSDLEKFIGEKRQTGVYFSVFGFGRGNLQSDTMEALALSGNGTYSYIDSQKEARRALVEQIGGSMITVAKDVKAGVSFNPEYVESYRLIGYENKLLTEDEFEDSSTDAGEIGSGHTVTVVYEIKTTEKEVVSDCQFAFVSLKYKPTENVEGEGEENIVYNVKGENYRTATNEDIFIASVIEFALILRESTYKADADINALITRLNELDLSGDEYKQEFRDLVEIYRINQEQKQQDED